MMPAIIVGIGWANVVIDYLIANIVDHKGIQTINIYHNGDLCN